jgi:putative MATE family efflux protein
MTEQKVPTTLGTEKIGKLLMQYAIPAIIAMTASSLYNMVDSIFIGQGVGAMAISGLALTFPLMNLAAAFGSLVGVGASTLASVKLGQHDYPTAQRILGNVLVLNVVLGVGFTILVMPFLDPILRFFGGSDQTVGYAKDYMEIILIGNVFTHMYFGLNAMLRSTGHPQKAMAATIATVLMNTVLDPIFIFGFGWGIRGAAIATIIAQVVSLMWQLKLFSNKNELLHFHKGIFKLKRSIVFDSLSIGMAPFLMNVAACFIVILINQGLQRYGGDLAIGAYGIVNRVTFIFVMIVIGLNQGMQPIAGYNFGARQYDRVTRVLKLTILYATIITTTGFICGEFFPRPIVSIFTSDPALIEISTRGYRIVVMFFPLIGFQIVTSNFFQSIGMAGKAIFLSVTRQVLFLIPGLLIFPHFFGQDGVWMSMPVSDLVATITSAWLLILHFRHVKRLKADATAAGE